MNFFSGFSGPAWGQVTSAPVTKSKTEIKAEKSAARAEFRKGQRFPKNRGLDQATGGVSAYYRKQELADRVKQKQARIEMKNNALKAKKRSKAAKKGSATRAANSKLGQMKYKMNLRTVNDAMKTVDTLKGGTAPTINKLNRFMDNAQKSAGVVYKKVRGPRMASALGKAGMFGIGMAGVMGLTLALSKTRHGRED